MSRMRPGAPRENPPTSDPPTGAQQRWKRGLCSQGFDGSAIFERHAWTQIWPVEFKGRGLTLGVSEALGKCWPDR